MKKLAIASYTLIIIATLLYATLTWGYYEYEWVGMRHFLGILLVRIAIIGLIAALFWLWPFRRNFTAALFSFSLIYFVSLLTSSVSTARELGRKWKATEELQTLNDNPSTYNSKVYSDEQYGEYVSILLHFQKFYNFEDEEIKQREKIKQNANLSAMLEKETLSNYENMNAARKTLQEAYHKVNALQRRSINYYENLTRIFLEQPYKNWVVKNGFDDLFSSQADKKLDLCYDLYNTLRWQIYALDDLLVFLMRREGLYSFENEKLLFNSDIDINRYKAFLKEIESLEQKENELLRDYSDSL